VDQVNQERHGTIDELLDSDPAESPQSSDSASKTRSGVASSSDQTGFNPYAHCSVQIARGHRGDMEKWLNFIKQFNAPPNTNG